MVRIVKKVCLLALLLLIPLNVVNAEEEDKDIPRETVTLVSCESAESFWIKAQNKKQVVRLIAFDTSVTDTEEIDNYTCDLVKSASKIEIEYDVTKKDEYNRNLVWMYLDGILLQEKLISEGKGQVNFVTADYRYLDNLCKIEANAVKGKLGIWSTGEVKEKYCDSGVIIEEQKKKAEAEKKAQETIPKKTLATITFYNSILLLLLLTLVRGYNAKKR